MQFSFPCVLNTFTRSGQRDAAAADLRFVIFSQQSLATALHLPAKEEAAPPSWLLKNSPSGACGECSALVFPWGVLPAYLPAKPPLRMQPGSDASQESLRRVSWPQQHLGATPRPSCVLTHRGRRNRNKCTLLTAGSSFAFSSLFFSWQNSQRQHFYGHCLSLL